MNKGAIAAGIAVLVPLALAAVSQSSDEPAAERTLPVRVVRTATADHFTIDERLAGRVVSRRSGELGFERAGRIERVLVDDGDRVDEGALLAELDTRELRAQRRELAARLESTRAQLELAKATVGRQTGLHDAEYLSPQRLDEAVANERSLTAQLAADRAALQRIEVSLELSQLRAPYPLVVADRRLDEGTVVAPGEALMVVQEDAPQRVEIGVPPQLAATLRPGDAYTIETDEGTLRATLDTVIPRIDTATRTQTAVLFVDEGEPRVADGALARVRFPRRVEARGSWVPIGALAEGRRGTWVAFAVVADDDGADRIERRQVEAIHSADERVFVRGTLRDGDRLVVDGLHRLVPGLRVRVQDDAALAQRTASVEPSVEPSIEP